MSAGKKQGQLDQIIDVPYFGDSKEVALLQVADFAALFLRRYAEIKEGLVGPKYKDEEQKVDGWIARIASRSIGRSSIYPRTGREYAHNLFFKHAPESIKAL